MPDERPEQNFYPKKPANAADFKKAVAWFGGRELIASLKGVIIYAIYGENIDPRSWMKANSYPNNEEEIIHHEKEKVQPKIEQKIQNQIKKEKAGNSVEEANLYSVMNTEAVEKIKKNEDVQASISREVEQEWAKKIFDYWEWKRTHYEKWKDFSENREFWKNLQPEDKTLKEFWFDYIADSGDGQMGVYNVACMCLSDLWLEVSKEEKNDDANAEKAPKEVEKAKPKVTFEPPEKIDPNKQMLLPRGAFLFVGGDTAYHASNYETLFERFQVPFRWAFTSVRSFLADKYFLKEIKTESFEKTNEKSNTEILENTSKELEGRIPAFINGKLYSDTEPPRPIFGIPANHDYYDGIDGFNRLFRRPPFDDIEENMTYKGSRGKLLLQIPTFSREQEASYIAIRLPFDWWMFGIDSENEKLDFRQELFFKQIIEKKPRKLILTTPEPTTVFGKKSADEDKTAVYLKTITAALGLSQPFLTDGKLKPENQDNEVLSKTAPISQTKAVPKDNESKADLSKKYCRLDLSGDVHHYARYWGENTKNFKTDKFSSNNYASVVSGGGGAFFDVTRTFIGKPLDENGNPLIEDGKVRGEIPPQEIYPSEKESVSKTADRIFDLWNIRKGGYVQIAGALIAVIIFFFLNYYSNVSEIDWGAEVFTSSFYMSNINYFGAIVFLMAVAAFVFASSFTLNKLIKTLKEKSLKGQLNEEIDGRVKQASYTFIPLIFATAVYLLFLLFAYDQNIVFKSNLSKIEGYFLSLILLLHLLISISVLWLSSEYTNWLTVRFKIIRKFKRKTFTQRLEDPNEPTNWKILKLLGKLSRIYSYKYIPANLLIVLAVVLLIIGINLFGWVEIAVTLADLLFTLTIVGVSILVSYFFACKVGAAYHRAGINKFYFFLLGSWHAFLQLVTPYILFFYGSWKVILGVFLLVILLNGSAILSYIIKKLFPRKNKDSLSNKIADFRLAALLTKIIDSRWLFFLWIIFGLLVISLPFIFRNTISFYDNIKYFVGSYLNTFDFYNNLQSLFNRLFMTDAGTFDKYIEVLISVAIVGYIGFVMSRVWLSWYLAVSMIFDGHNNEVGGAARIEGFKHILRVKVEEEKLTVYVIGFDEAEPELKDLNLKLVDKFVLESQSIS